MQTAQIDVTIAYLNETKDTMVHIERPDMLRQKKCSKKSTKNDLDLIKKAKAMLNQLGKGEQVCRLNKSLYGLRQEGR